MNQDLTTLICLFHHSDQAHAALQDILKADVPEANVTLIGGDGSNIAASRTTLTELNVPDHDLKHLLEGLEDGGIVLTVSAISNHVEAVEEIFRPAQSRKDRRGRCRRRYERAGAACRIPGRGGHPRPHRRGRDAGREAHR